AGETEGAAQGGALLKGGGGACLAEGSFGGPHLQIGPIEVAVRDEEFSEAEAEGGAVERGADLLPLPQALPEARDGLVAAFLGERHLRPRPRASGGERRRGVEFGMGLQFQEDATRALRIAGMGRGDGQVSKEEAAPLAVHPALVSQRSLERA